MIFAATSFSGRRLRTRRVTEESFAKSVGRRALKQDDWVVDVTTGGGVCNSYGYPAETECVLAVGDPMGVVVYWTSRAPANKVTLRGAAEACLVGAGDLFDKRVKSASAKEITLDFLKRSHRQIIPAMVVIAASSR